MEFSTRQKEIIETAMDIITQDGIEGLTIKRIATKIGVSEPALYRHFLNKEDILFAILDFFETRARTLLDAVVKDNNLSSLEKLNKLLLTRAADFADNPASMVVILSEELFPNGSRLSLKVYGVMKANREVIISIVKEGQSNGIIRKDINPDMLFYIIIGPFRFMVNRWRLSGFGFDLKMEFSSFWTSLEKMIRN